MIRIISVTALRDVSTVTTTNLAARRGKESQMLRIPRISLVISNLLNKIEKRF
jgi:hypothetical protein